MPHGKEDFKPFTKPPNYHLITIMARPPVLTDLPASALSWYTIGSIHHVGLTHRARDVVRKRVYLAIFSPR